MNLDALPERLGNNRTPRRQQCDLIVIHTNEGPEGPTTAEGLAGFLAQAPDNYNVIVDENGAIRTAGDNEVVWGAGGVNSRAWHICITGRASFPVTVWSDPSESKAVAIVADLARQAAAKFGIPFSRVTDSRPPHRGVCGHVDVSRYYPASQGHTDPGPNFPWDRIFNTPAAPTPTPKEDEHMRIIYGDKFEDRWLTNWLTKRHIGANPGYDADAQAQAKALHDGGVTDGAAEIRWPQAWVDQIPVSH